VKTYWRSGGVAPHFLNLGTRWRWVVSFTSLPPYSPVKRTTRVGPWASSGATAERKNYPHSPCRELNLGGTVRSPVTILTWTLPLLVWGSVSQFPSLAFTRWRQRDLLASPIVSEDKQGAWAKYAVDVQNVHEIKTKPICVFVRMFHY
jgi:hypothetical protein